MAEYKHQERRQYNMMSTNIPSSPAGVGVGGMDDVGGGPKAFEPMEFLLNKTVEDM